MCIRDSNNSEYLEIENAEYLRSIGIDSLIYPERLAAEEIVASLKQIGSRQMHEFSDGRLQLLGIKLWDNALILNHTLIKMAEIYGADQFRIVAIKRHNHTIIQMCIRDSFQLPRIAVCKSPKLVPAIKVKMMMTYWI